MSASASSGGGSAPELRVDHRAVLETVQGEESRHEAAHHGFRSTDHEVQDVISGWIGMGSRVFGGHWDNTCANVVSAFDSWSARNGNTRDSMGEYHGQDGESADNLDATNDAVAAVMARINW